MKKLSTYDISLVGMFAALMAVGANITSWAPFLEVAGVPLSMQPFFCILAGLLLGSRLGALSMTIYALVGIAGAPVFAQFSGGIGVIFGSTGGFILSYIVTAFLVGKVMELSKEKKATAFFTASFVGITTIYVVGTTYMWLALNVWMNAPMSYGAAWAVMLWFIVKDVAFTILGAAIAPRIYFAVTKATSKRIAA
ncbi:biotin transport system substrate-specific component [Metabacillus crassostreae]|uniref:biotin transporter BioY n=1 Tax=Metabacillus crassostreae TaxID=929098 RepID=UPI001EF94967|nr:biotin transporter BioY [Metabacillus crassostreae]MBM7605412.1 biotin transport system substrate-specific component [Metabacillus crassostreae]